MACLGNLRRDIVTVGISTEENTLADMELMFLHRRFALLPDIRALPRLYLRMTAGSSA